MYLSCKFTKAERAYSVIEREALAVKWTLNALSWEPPLS